MIYQMNDKYYLEQGDKYFLAEIVIKPNTIVINPTSEYVTELADAKEVSYHEVKSRYIKEESTDVGSLNSNEVE